MAGLIPPGADLSRIPVGTPPPGVKSNFVNPQSLSSVVTGVGVTMGTVAFLFVVTRLYSNFRATRKLALDDYFSIFALITSMGYTGVAISMNDTARHSWDVPVLFVDNAAYVKKIFVGGMLYGPSIWFAKAAILTLYLRVFSVKRWIAWLIYFALGFLFVLYWLTVGFFPAYCAPHKGGAWDLAVLLACAPKTGTIAIVQGVFSVVSDIYILILPLPVIFRLKISRKRKIGLGIVFMTGIFAIIASAIALRFRVLNWQGKDSTWNSAKTLTCVFVEIYVVIIVGCAPAMASLWKNVLSHTKLFTSLRSFFYSLTSRSQTLPISIRHSSTRRATEMENSESLRHLPQANYLELDGLNGQTPSTEISSSGKWKPGNRAEGGFITKSISLNQEVSNA